MDPVDYRPAKIEALIADDSLIAVFTSYIRTPPPHDNQLPNTPVGPCPIVEGRPNFPRIFRAEPNLLTVLFFSPFWLMMGHRNSHLALLLFASRTFVLGSSDWRGRGLLGNVGGLPKLKVYALKFGIHVGERWRPLWKFHSLNQGSSGGVDHCWLESPSLTA